MVLLDPFEYPALKIGMVHGIMHHIIDQVAENKSGEKSPQVALIGKEQGEHEIKYKSQGDAGGRRHDESHGVPGVIVVYPVKDKMHSPAPGRGWLKMKDEPVQDVLCAGPYEHAQHKEPDQGQHRSTYSNGPVYKIRDHRDIDEQRHSEVHLGQRFHPGAFEHAYGFR